VTPGARTVWRQLQRPADRALGPIEVGDVPALPRLADVGIAEPVQRAGVARIALDDALVVRDVVVGGGDDALGRRRRRRQREPQRDEQQ
jgi:hypothetical protein